MTDAVQEQLYQRQLIQSYSREDEDSLNKLFFQEMVLEALAAEEKAAYIDRLLGKRPKFRPLSGLP